MTDRIKTINEEVTKLTARGIDLGHVIEQADKNGKFQTASDAVAEINALREQVRALIAERRALMNGASDDQ